MQSQPALAAIAALSATFACLWILLSPLGRRLMLDQPNDRSLHKKPVPRSGGIAIAAGVAAGAGFSPPELRGVLGIAGLLALLSLADDAFTLPTLVRLVAHLAAAAAVLALEFGFTDPVLFAVLMLAIAWYANLYNFMDGSDGLAGGMAVFGFGAYLLAAHQAGHGALAACAGSISAASLAFLLVNFHPARLFMGDVGSVPLGFLAGALGVLGWRDGIWPFWFPLLVFAPFVCDATLTLLKRLVRRERVWQAHKDHYYQRLVRMGFGHRSTACIEYLVMIGCAAAALLARNAGADAQAVTLGAAAVVLGAVALWIDVRWARFRREVGGASA